MHSRRVIAKFINVKRLEKFFVVIYLFHTVINNTDAAVCRKVNERVNNGRGPEEGSCGADRRENGQQQKSETLSAVRDGDVEGAPGEGKLCGVVCKYQVSKN
ncbi:UNVERIFIED_CONTAM: hypothetical protein PYX00_001745 [Menopon gallinae]|uniref:Secreted protein n=1 Tax=Menopon gallinae TaxID=328185 RepID=A0AAW2IDR8_9NEOP